MEHICTRCLRSTPRDDLTVKKVIFQGMGNRAVTRRTRVVEWLCQSCLVGDSDYNCKPYKSGPERMDDARSRRKATPTSHGQGVHGQVSKGLDTFLVRDPHLIHYPQ